MTEQLTEEQIAQIIEALNKAIAEGPWDDSNFLKIVGKNLVAIRDNFIAQTGTSPEEQSKLDAQAARQLALRSNQLEIYISLYCADGTNLQNWERIVTNLPKQTISRPIYDDEDDVKEVQKLKEKKVNEAYVAIFVDKDAILPTHPERVTKDKLGTPLLNLKDRTINLENLSRFVHSTGVYQYIRGRLIPLV